MLDTKFITSPVFALDQCKKATDKMAAYTQVALHTAIDLVLEYSDEGAGKVDKLEKTVDDYEDTLNSYLVTMTNMNFSPKDSHMFTLVMHVIGDFERMTDHALNIMQSAREMHEKGQEFSPKAQEELRIFHAALEDIVDRAITAFQDVDLRLASTVEPLEDVIDGLNMEVKRRHVRRLRKGKCTIELGIALEDITTDYERIADHCNNIAVYLSQMNETGFEKHDYIEHLADAAKADFLRQAEDFETKYQLPDQKAADLEAEEPEKEAKADKKKKKKDKK
jgi:phosphate:Na+ symporter